jgi:hypothetical protein
MELAAVRRRRAHLWLEQLPEIDPAADEIAGDTSRR